MSAISSGGIEAASVATLLERERERFSAGHPLCRDHHRRSSRHWLNGVPMHWMSDWDLPVPLIVREARNATLTDIDGHAYADFCLGDTGAMFGHSPPAIVEALRGQADRGVTSMLPTEVASRVGELLGSRFGLPFWQITQTATDANRAVLRWARELTGRNRILVFDGCYHGSLEDTLVRLDAGRVVTRSGQIGQIADYASHARVVEFNDLAALETELAHRDVACALAEPVMTNAGMVLPDDDFWPRARAMCDRYGSLLAIDETHTLSSGPGGYARRIRLTPDFLTIGKAIAGGVACAVYGFTADLAERMTDLLESKPAGHSGMGTTLAANALATTALAACLEHVMTETAYAHMLRLSSDLVDGLRQRIAGRGLPWHVVSVGARSELSFGAHPARTARQSRAASMPALERTLHLYLLNRGVLIAPFHNMMLVSPATTSEQVHMLLHAFDQFCGEIR